MGVRCENDGCSILNAQCQVCMLIANAAIPCNKEVPVAVTILGLTVFPKQGFCMKQGEIMER